MDYLCNNHKNQPHEEIYGRRAFYDIYTSDRQAVWADHLVPGDTCVVMSEPIYDQLNFDWYTFSHKTRGRFDGKPTHLFFGDLDPARTETLSRAQARRDPMYSKFFKTDGTLKRQNLLRAI
jgi:hypothetical protein